MTDITDAHEVVVTPGDWVLFRIDGYSPVDVHVKQAVKVTPSLVKFGGNWPRQCHIMSVVASFADEERARKVAQSIGGVAGEYTRRRRAAQDEAQKRITAALAAANEQVRRLVRGEQR